MYICVLAMPYLFILLILLALGGILINRSLYGKLKSTHPDVYKTLGEPTIFLNNSIKNSLLVNKFIWKRQYLKLRDKKTVRFCDLVLIYSIVIWIMLIVFIAVTICFISR